MKKKWIVLTAIVGIILLGLIAAGPFMSNVETPSYEVIQSQGKIEIRQLEAMITAEVLVNEERKTAIKNGFRLLADFIFGNNTPRQAREKTSQAQPQLGTKIAMTAPVQQQLVKNSWQVSFVMPSEYSLKSLPIPHNDSISIIRASPRQFIVITFSGTASDNNLRQQEERLMEFINTNDLSVTGTPKYAFYNPPWTLPFMRRNEIMLEIK